jgi:predicted Zn-dependent peptidase
MPIDRTTLPPVGADPAFAFPPVARHRLDNGLEVCVVEERRMPIVSFALVVAGGSGIDARGCDGLAGIVADMLDEGSGTRGAIEISEELASVGAEYEVEVGPDATTASMTTLARFADRGAWLLADMTVRPALRQADFERVRQLRRDRLRQMKDVPGAVAERAFLHLLYGDHPYGHLAIGDEESLAGLSLEDVAVAHASSFVPSRATMVVAGGLPASDLLALARDAFGAWSGRTDATARVPAAEVPMIGNGRPRLALVPREGAAQSEVRIGRLVSPRLTPQYPSLVVMNAVLGGQFVSRINLKLREEKAYTYGARTGFDWKKGISPLALHASVHTASTAEAIADTMAEFDGLRGLRPVTASELELAKASLTRGYPQHFQTVPQLARAVGQLSLFELPENYFSTFIPLINAVSADDVSRVACEYLDPEACITLVVGDERVVAEPLSRLGLPVLEVVPGD